MKSMKMNKTSFFLKEITDIFIKIISIILTLNFSV